MTSETQNIEIIGKPHWFLNYFLPTLVFFVGIFFTFIFIGEKDNFCPGISGFIAAVGLTWMGVSFFRSHNSYIKITNKSVSGKIGKREFDFPNESIKNFQVITNPIVSAIGYCSILITLNSDEVLLKGINHEAEIKNAASKIFGERYKTITVIRK